MQTKLNLILRLNQLIIKTNELKLIFRKFGSIRENVNQINRNDNSLHLSHRPVMCRQIMEAFRPKDGQTFIDMTFGSGGHTKHLLATNKKIQIYALDRDPIAYQRAVVLSKNQHLAQNGQKIIPLLGRFSEFPTLMAQNGVKSDSIDGIIMDLGVSSMQFDDNRRGFALSSDGPLDMRMDGQRFESMPTAGDVVNTLSAEHLAKIFKIYGEERLSLKIAQTIIDSRFLMKRLSSTTELANLVANISSNYQSFDGLGRAQHSATKVFQAIRIFVNNELNELNFGLEKVRKYLKRTTNIDPDDKSEVIDNLENIDGGVIAVLSFHSLEDRIVKKHLMGIDSQSIETKHFNHLEAPTEQDLNTVLSKDWKPINKKVILPDEEEVIANPRCRSAKLRLAVRVL